MAQTGISSILAGPSQSTGGGDVYSILGQRRSAGAKLRAVLDEAAVKSGREQFFNNVALRVEALRTGQIQPEEDWEKVAAFLATRGRPAVVGVDKQGKVVVDEQAQTDLARYNEAEKRTLLRALDEVGELARRLQANQQNDALIAKLRSVPPILDDIVRNGLPAAPGWQTEAMLLAKGGVPFQVVLDDKGELSVVNQLQSSFFGRPPGHIAALLRAVEVVRTTLQTGFSDGSVWAAQAQVYGENDTDYFLDIDPITLSPVVKRNDAATIVPEFLKKAPFPDIGADRPWKEQAAEMIAAGKSFYLDIDRRGEVIVRANDGRGINLFDRPRNEAVRNPVIDLLA